LGAAIILVLSLSIIKDLDLMTRSESLDFLIGTTTREDYLDKNLGWYSRAARELNDLPKTSKILAFWEPRGFYLPVYTQPDVWIDRWYMTVQDHRTKEEIVRNWKQNNITHLLINLKGMEFEKETQKTYQDEDWEILKGVLDSLPPPRLFGDEYALYTIN
jgi:hypothetical protein